LGTKDLLTSRKHQDWTELAHPDGIQVYIIGGSHEDIKIGRDKSLKRDLLHLMLPQENTKMERDQHLRTALYGGLQFLGIK